MSQSSAQRLLTVLRSHPAITTILVACVIAGGGLGYYLLTGEWSGARRVAAGSVGGAGVGLIITAGRMIGWSDDRMIGQ